MKKLLMLLLIAVAFAGCEKLDPVAEMDSSAELKSTELVGAHFNLNIIGVKDKVMDDISAGHVIFVDLNGTSEIKLVPGEFAVLDKNGTDLDGAMFQLPEPGFEPYVTEYPYGYDTQTDYSVYVRALGKPLTGTEITTVADLSSDALEVLGKQDARLWENIMDNYEILNIVWGEWIPNPVNVERVKGKSPWVNVTAELLSVVYTIVVTYDTNTAPDVVEEATVTLHVRIPIFSDLLEGEYWKYTNDGLKLLQVRFYPFGTDVTYDDVENGWDQL